MPPGIRTPPPTDHLGRTLDMLARVCAVQDELLQTDRPSHALFGSLLGHLLETTGSARGFIGEVLQERGRSRLVTRASADDAGDASTGEGHADDAGQGARSPPDDGLLARVQRGGEVYFCDTPSEDDASWFPRGHAPLTAFAAVPVRLGGELVGLIGLGDRPGGYHSEVIAPLAPLVGAVGHLFSLLRARQARHAAEAAVARRLAFERLILEISTHFIHTTAADFDAAVDAALARVGRFVEADRSYLFLIADDRRFMSNTHEWCAEGIRPEKDNLRDLEIEVFPFAMTRLAEGEPMVVADVPSMPDEAGPLRDSLMAQSILSLVLVPLHHEGLLRGFVGFDAVRAHRAWSHDDAALLLVLANSIGHLLRRTQGARRLAESERRFRLIASHVKQAFFLVGADYGKMLYVSPAFEEIFGLPCRTVQEDPLVWLGLVDPEHRPKVEANMARQHLASVTTEYRILRPDGVARWVLVHTLPVHDHDGAVRQVAGIAEDITERHTLAEVQARHAEALEEAVRTRTEELRRTTTALRTVADTMPVAVLILDGDRVRYANPTAESLLGMRSGEALQPSHAALADAARTDGDHYEMELSCPDGVRREVQVLARAVDFEGRSCRLVAAVDVTQQRSAERTLREHRIATARLAYIGNMEGLASAVAHELNQPLNAIVMWSGGLRVKLERGEVGRDELVDVVGRLREQALRAGELMRRLRSFSTRDDERRLRLEIDGVCEQAVRQVQEAARAEQIELVCELGAGGCKVVGDAVQLEVVLTNLLRNAIEANALAAREAEARGERPVRRVELRSRATTAGAHVSVRDHGGGVPLALRSTIFEPLVSTKPGGMGIGLSIARSIAEAHRGRLSLGESEGEGAVFEVLLPEAVGPSGGDRD